MERLDYFPFGEGFAPGMNGRSTDYPAYNAGARPANPKDGESIKFTGKERDAETALDYFGARYFASVQGRFTNPDNFLNDTTARDPQSWNLYSYVRNSPLRYVDPSGERIYAGGLSEEDRKELLARINGTYGCEACVSIDKKGYLQVDTSGLRYEMLLATSFLTGAINSEKFSARVEVSNNDSSLAFGETQLRTSSVPVGDIRVNASLVRLDFADDRWLSGDPEATRAFTNLVFAHEIAHIFPTLREDATGVNSTGPVVDSVNWIRDLLKEPLRTGYVSKGANGFLSLPFSKSTVDKNGHTKENTVWINWVRKNVGGKGIN